MTLPAVLAEACPTSSANQATPGHAAVHSAASPSCFTLCSLFARLQPCRKQSSCVYRACCYCRFGGQTGWVQSERALRSSQTSRTLLSPSSFGCPPRIRDPLTTCQAAPPSLHRRQKVRDESSRQVETPAPLPVLSLRIPEPNYTILYVCSSCMLLPHDGPKSLFPRLSKLTSSQCRECSS